MKELATEFTMAEFIEHHKLGVSVNDRAATSVIAAYLYTKGYAKVRKRHNGMPRTMWTKTTGTTNKLKEKLRDL